jgi:hypothetical protein
MGMTQDQRRSRRREIAEFVEKGNLPFDAAKRWGVSLATVKTACLENQVQFSTATTDAAEAESTEDRRTRGRMKLLRIVAALLSGEDQKTIARREKNSKQYISRINQFAEEAGIFQAVEGLRKKAEEASQLAREAKKGQAREERVEVKKGERLVQLVNAGKNGRRGGRSSRRKPNLRLPTAARTRGGNLHSQPRGRRSSIQDHPRLAGRPPARRHGTEEQGIH